MLIGCQDSGKEIRHKELCVLWIGLLHVYNTMNFYDLLLFVIHVSALDKAWGSPHVYQPECDTLRFSRTLLEMSDCRCLDREAASQLGNY